MKPAVSRVLLCLVLAQFIITVDTTFMNVSLSTLVKDLHTTVTGVQSAITLYALVMAALMIPGAKLGDLIGRKRAFICGLAVYGTGTLVTSLSGSLTIFMIGWCILEGVGAALMLPAMMSLIADNFQSGPSRAHAYSTFAATAGIAAALGPVIGGLFTTFLSWRLAFASELLAVLYIVLNRGRINETYAPPKSRQFDWAGFGLSAAGLLIAVQGIILASTYGLIKARQDYSFAGITLKAGGISPTVVFVAVGLILLAAFVWLEARKLRLRQVRILDVGLLKLRTVNAGSLTQMMQAFVIAGVIFALSLYVQVQLGYSAIQSGLTLLPLSFGVVALSAVAGRRLVKSYSPKTIMLVGFVLIVTGSLLMGLTARNANSGIDFLFGLLFIGSGVGMVVSQNQNLIISSVSADQTNETSGIVNTFQNIGTSLGTSIAGAIIIGVFISVSTGLINSSASFTSPQKTQLNNAVVSKAQIVSNAQLERATSHLPPDQQSQIVDINQQAREKGLTVVYFVIAAVGLIGVYSASRLPKTPPLAYKDTPKVKVKVKSPKYARAM